MSDDADQVHQNLETINLMNQTSEPHHNVNSQVDFMNDGSSSRATTSAFDGGVTVVALVVGLGVVVAALLSMASSH
ncbi:MAG TPA: hypothetical protein VGM98_19620 [Schlesneria sp.]|jgi:hypothetical protein